MGAACRIRSAKTPFFRRCSNAGFTLIEMIFVVVILGAVAAIGSSFMLTAVDSYRKSQIHNQLVQRGRLTLEQMSRELRMAVPNAVRVSASGQCVEFLPVLAAVNYQGTLPAQNNNLTAVTQIPSGSFAVDTATAEHVVVAPFAPAEVYSTANPAARVLVGVLGSAPFTSVPLLNSHRFMRNSLSRRLFLAADPVRFCVTNNQLIRYSNYGLSTSALGDNNPGGTGALMAHMVAANGTAFVLSPGSDNRNMALVMQLRFTNSTATLNLNQQVLIRNVP